MNRAKFLQEVTVIDPDSQGEVQVSIFKHENGGIFGIDSSYIEQVLGDGPGEPYIPDPLVDGAFEHVTLEGV